MAIDTQSLASIGNLGGFDPVGAKGKALSIKDMMDREQLNQLQLGQEKQKAAENTKVAEILKGEGVDYSSPEGVMRTAEKINKVSPRAAMDFQMQAQQVMAGKGQIDLQQLQILEKQQDTVVGAIDPIVAEARAMKNAGQSDLVVNAFIMQKLPGALQALKDTKLPDGRSALTPQILQAVQTAGPISLTTLEAWDARSKQGQAALKQRLDQFKADTAAKGEATRERAEASNERHQRAEEDLARQKDAAKRGGFEGAKGDLMAALADRGVSLPAGFRAKEQQVALLDGLIRRHPDMSPDQIADGIKSGQLAFGNAKTEGRVAAGVAGKVTYAEHEIEQTIPLLRDASARVPRGKWVPFNKLKQMGDRAYSDPDLKEMAAYMTSLSNAYDLLAARGGTDAAKREHNRELFNTAESPEALDRALKAIENEAKASGRAADQSMADAVNRGGGAGAADRSAGGGGAAPTQVLRFDAQGNPVP